VRVVDQSFVLEMCLIGAGDQAVLAPEPSRKYLENFELVEELNQYWNFVASSLTLSDSVVPHEAIQANL